MQQKRPMAEDDDNERGDDVPSARPNSHSKHRHFHLGVNQDEWNVALRSEGQVDTRQPDGSISEDLNHRN